MNIVIVAGGLGTRFGNLSVFPKILLPTNKYNSILEEDLSIIDLNSNKVFLIINQKFFNMTQNYLKVNHLDDKVILLSTNNTNGSYNSILNCWNNISHFPTNDVLFIWSDIVLKSIPNIENNINTVFTYTNGQKYRYKIVNNKISLTDKYDGNIPGVYYINNLKDVFIYPENSFDNYDLVDGIKDSKIEIVSKELDSLFEYRDYDTYINKIKEYTNNNLKTRFFNKLSVDDKTNTLIKKAIDPDYYPIIEKEYNWYEYGKKYDTTGKFNTVVPKTHYYVNHSFSMDYLNDYKPLHSVLKSEDMTIPKVKRIYSNIKDSIDKVGFVTKDFDKDLVFNPDLRKEVIDKVISRCDKIQYMLINYNKEYMTSLLCKAFKYLFKLEKKENVKYKFGHGDLNGSNILVNPNTLEVKFVDPRGYFGNTDLFIWPEYEYAKLLYCLYGYDDFNNLPQIYGVDKPKKLRWINNIKFLQDKKYRILVGVIYVALAGYISQDIMKANIAYEYGIELLENELL